jgi:RNA polymerase sigma factor (TIGR02999 family)
MDEARRGDADAMERLVRVIYAELRRMASGLMHFERPGHTLQPCDLVHEVLMRPLEVDTMAEVPNHHCLFAAAAKAMCHVLIDHARRRRARKREGTRVRVPLDEALAYFEEQHLDVEAVHEALDRLALQHARPAQVVELRFFGGLTAPEVAEILDDSVTTVEGDWRFARAWLHGELGGLAP